MFPATNWSPVETKKARRTMKRIITLCMISVPIVTPSGPAQLIKMPCFPGHLGYFLFNPCFDPAAKWNLFPDLTLRIVIVAGVVWILLEGFICAVMEVAIYSTIHCYCLTNYHFLFLRNSLRDQNVSRSVQMYRELQLLVINYNRIRGGNLSVLITILLSTTIVLPAYLVLGVPKELSLAQLIRFCFVIFISSVIIIFCVGGFKAAVNIVSKGILESMKASAFFMKNRALRRYVKSWQLAKIKLGSTNFYDKETPLNLMGFCVSQVVNLLLL